MKINFSKKLLGGLILIPALVVFAPSITVGQSGVQVESSTVHAQTYGNSSNSGTTSRGGRSRSSRRRAVTSAPVAPTVTQLVTTVTGNTATVVTPVTVIPATTATCPAFTQYMGMGSTGPQVVLLQQYLQERGYFTYPRITGYYGPVTAAAVSQWQAANRQYVIDPWGLNAPTGYFGQSSRAFANHTKGCQEASVLLVCPGKPDALWTVPEDAIEVRAY